MAESESKRRSNSTRDKENWQYITFKARTGSKDRIAEAADAAGISINGFIRDAVSKAVKEVIDKPLEPTHEEAAEVMVRQILREEVNKLLPMELGRTSRKEIEDEYENNIKKYSSIFGEVSQVLSSDLPPKTKGKRIRNIENKKRKDIQWFIRDYLS